MRLRPILRLKVRLSGLILGVALSAVLTGCGGSDAEKVDADDWVDDICDATATMAEKEDEGVEGYYDISSGDVDELRDAFGEYVDVYSKALDRFARSAERAGEPDVDQGNKVAAAVQAWVEEEKKNLERAERATRNLKTVEDMDTAFEDIELADFLELLEDTKSSDLNDLVTLFDENEECSRFLFVD